MRVGIPRKLAARFARDDGRSSRAVFIQLNLTPSRPVLPHSCSRQATLQKVLCKSAVPWRHRTHASTQQWCLQNHNSEVASARERIWKVHRSVPSGLMSDFQANSRGTPFTLAARKGWRLWRLASTLNIRIIANADDVIDLAANNTSCLPDMFD